MRPINILTVCGHGLGSSMMLKMTLEEICTDLGIDFFIETKNASEASGFIGDVDMLITTNELLDVIDIDEDKDMRVVTVESFLDKEEVREKIEGVIEEWREKGKKGAK